MTDSRETLIGRTLDGRYRIESLVARGGMATVYVANDLRLRRNVAVKVMHTSLAEDPEFVHRFEREAHAAAQLTNPHVVAVHDQGRDAHTGVVYLVMEYVSGRTVRDIMAARGALTETQALAILDPVLQALAAAHDAGFVHRDVKPENVLISDDGRIKVTDFGLARAIVASPMSAATQGVLIGTVAYLSPEQVDRGYADARSDVYGAGVLLYELLTGNVPHTGETPLAVAYQHVHNDVPAPSVSTPGLSATIDTLVEKATRRDPAQRFQNAREFLAAVRTARAAVDQHYTPVPMPAQHTVIIDDEPSPAQRTVTLARDEQPRRRRRKLPLAGGRHEERRALRIGQARKGFGDERGVGSCHHGFVCGRVPSVDLAGVEVHVGEVLDGGSAAGAGLHHVERGVDHRTREVGDGVVAVREVRSSHGALEECVLDDVFGFAAVLGVAGGQLNEAVALGDVQVAEPVHGPFGGALGSKRRNDGVERLVLRLLRHGSDFLARAKAVFSDVSEAFIQITTGVTGFWQSIYVT